MLQSPPSSTSASTGTDKRRRMNQPPDTFWARVHGPPPGRGGSPPKAYHCWRDGRALCGRPKAPPARRWYRLRPEQNVCAKCAEMQHGRNVLAGARWQAPPAAEEAAV
jgi:hypothetical protein